MSIVKEFREFIARGNVIDLAVGVIIGAAFNGIVKSLVDQVIMPPIGWLTGGIDFAKLKYILPANPIAPKGEPVAILYGAFINTLIQFLIVAVVVFLLVKLVNKIRRADANEPAPETPPAPTTEERLLTEIRDLLAKPAVVAAPAAAKAVATPKAVAPKAKSKS